MTVDVDSAADLSADTLALAQDALAKGAWAEARDILCARPAARESPEAEELLGIAAFWLEDADLTLRARGDAYRLYRRRGDSRGAARVAIALADDYFTFRAQPHVAGGWLELARKLLEPLDSGPEHGLLECEAGFLALMADHDVEGAATFGATAARLGRTLAVPDIEHFGDALAGLGEVASGNRRKGFAAIERAVAAVTSGDVEDPSVGGAICCLLIFACELVRDFGRAAEWCAHVASFCRERGLTSLLGVCQAHHAGVLTARGHYAEAERLLERCTSTLTRTRPGLAPEAFVRLGQLRLRQGRLEEARGLFARAPLDPAAILGAAEVAYAEGAGAQALMLLGHLVGRPSAQRGVVRGEALALRIRIAAGTNPRTDLSEDLDDLVRISSSIDSLHGMLSWARAAVALSAGRLDEAILCYGAAIEEFTKEGSVFETARVREELAGALDLAGRFSEAAAARESSAGTLRELRGERPRPAGLTLRELEVLRLVARGLSNSEIATELVLSVRTVERHVTTIYEKLGASGPSSRVAAATFARDSGLV